MVRKRSSVRIRQRASSEIPATAGIFRSRAVFTSLADPPFGSVLGPVPDRRQRLRRRRIQRRPLPPPQRQLQLAARAATCSDTTKPPRTCPASASPTLAVDETPLSEGSHSFRQVTQDLAGNTSASASWTVNVDRTAPGTAPGLAHDFVGYYDPSSQQADIMWSPPSDHVGDTFDVDVITADAVGNIGAAASAHIVTQSLPDTSGCQAHDIGGYPVSCVDQAQEDAPMDDEEDASTASLVADPASQAAALTGSIHHTDRIAVEMRPGQPNFRRITAGRQSATRPGNTSPARLTRGRHPVRVTLRPTGADT
ncbi:MAG: hypothetical protein JWM93_3079 [Frankiales bacterium]|nr:hypothetical protein [Frankiales bacterium]